MGIRRSRGSRRDPPRLADADRLLRPGGSRRRGEPRGVRFGGQGARGAPRGPAAPLHAPAEGAGALRREESPGVAGDGDAVHGIRRRRRIAFAAARRGVRPGVHAGSAAAARAPSSSRRCDEARSEGDAARPGNLAPGGYDPRRSTRAAEEAPADVRRRFPRLCRDVQENVGRLLSKGFIERTPYERLQHFPRYLKAAAPAAGQAARGSPARRAPRRRARAASGAVAARAAEAGEVRRARFAAGAVPLAARGAARAALRPGAEDAGAGLGQEADEDVAD